jgi:phosphoglycolate phosphatase
MAKKRLIVFDLDGTINNSADCIIHCFRRTGEAYGKYDIPDDVINSALTGPFDTNIAKVLGLKHDQVLEAINEYAVHFEKASPIMSHLFTGAMETLEYLKALGYKIGLATMMVDSYAVDILERYGVIDLFDSVHGIDRSFVCNKKEELIRSCMDDTGIGPAETVMIGDGFDDHRAAMEAGTDFIAALYGFGLDEEYCERTGIRGIRDITELKSLFSQRS